MSRVETYEGEAWDWLDIAGRMGGVAITAPDCGQTLVYVRQTPAQMRELSRRLLNAAYELESRA